MTTEPLTDDRLLDGRVHLRQPDVGYRAAIDPILLAAAIPAAPGERVLDLGCGAGAASLCLAARTAGVRVQGIDIQAEAIALAENNALASELQDQTTFITGDILRLPGSVASGGFDHVMANPPYLKAGASRPPPDPTKALSHVEGEAELIDWVRVAHSCVKPSGTITLVHRYDRRDELMNAFAALNGTALICPLWSHPGRETAKRVLVQWRGTPDTSPRETLGIVLHQADGSFMPETEAVLRGGAAVPPEAWSEAVSGPNSQDAS